MIEVYIDGASAGNPGPSGAGIFIKNAGKVERFSLFLGEMTNHEAEFHALLHALKICLQNGFRTISIRTDSELVSRSMEKEFVKNKGYADLLHTALQLSKQFELFFIKWIPSSENKTADELARQGIRKHKEKGANTKNE
ncbi:reverse transcriptase-like protein [Cytobacillus sp. Hz8]|uniref:reverse transcriptase-like protein n=1 Tax=Cytobacillus sp. Hz8 TaxID=3347168 RepID=UPI0035D8B6AA